MRRAQDRARSARARKIGARCATIEYYGARNATIKSRAPSALKLASCARSARWECAREAGRFFFHNNYLFQRDFTISSVFLTTRQQFSIYRRYFLFEEIFKLSRNLNTIYCDCCYNDFLNMNGIIYHFKNFIIKQYITQ